MLYAKIRLADMEWEKGKAINDITPETAAEHVVKNVQQRLAQAVVKNKAPYKADPEETAAIPKMRR